METAQPKKLLNQQQRKYVKDRLEEIKSAAHSRSYKIQRSGIENDEGVPPGVLKARAIVKSYEKTRRRVNEAKVQRLKIEWDQIREAIKPVREKMLFCSPEEALEELRKLEKRFGK